MTTPGSTAASGDEGRFRRLSDHSLLDSFLRNPRKKACILPIKARPPAEIRNWKLPGFAQKLRRGQREIGKKRMQKSRVFCKALSNFQF
jgi:hypothetical protein